MQTQYHSESLVLLASAGPFRVDVRTDLGGKVVVIVNASARWVGEHAHGRVVITWVMNHSAPHEALLARFKCSLRAFMCRSAIQTQPNLTPGVR
eukprot:SAG31_NODE_67_length_28318_cov_6.493674_29_plen_94_part_00